MASSESVIWPLGQRGGASTNATMDNGSRWVIQWHFTDPLALGFAGASLAKDSTTPGHIRFHKPTVQAYSDPLNRVVYAGACSS